MNRDNLGAAAADAFRKANNIKPERISSVRNIIETQPELVLVERSFTAPLDGAYAYDESLGKGFIYSNLCRPWVRRRFTLAHELGHHSLDHKTRVDADIENVTEAAERDANEFAAELLMPSKALFEASRIHGAEEVAELAGHFMVSGKAAIFRLFNLKLIDRRLFKKLIDSYSAKFYATFLERSEDEEPSRATRFPKDFLQTVLSLYERGSISAEAACDALDQQYKNAEDASYIIASMKR